MKHNLARDVISSDEWSFTLWLKYYSFLKKSKYCYNLWNTISLDQKCEMTELKHVLGFKNNISVENITIRQWMCALRWFGEKTILHPTAKVIIIDIPTGENEIKRGVHWIHYADISLMRVHEFHPDLSTIDRCVIKNPKCLDSTTMEILRSEERWITENDICYLEIILK